MPITNKKRGLSPVIATVLLISIALILAVIIFLWAKSFIDEQAIKFDRPIEDSCPEISFDAQVIGTEISVVNRGNVPIYGLEAKKSGLEEGSIKSVGYFDRVIKNGEDGSIDVGAEIELYPGDQVIIQPTILGESGDYKKPYTCGSEYGVTTEVQA